MGQIGLRCGHAVRVARVNDLLILRALSDQSFCPHSKCPVKCMQGHLAVNGAYVYVFECVEFCCVRVCEGVCAITHWLVSG